MKICRENSIFFKTPEKNNCQFTPKYVCFVQSSTKYLVARQQLRVTKWSLFHGNNQQFSLFYIVDSDIYRPTIHTKHVVVLP